MTYETYRLIFIIGAILAGVMLVISVILFFLLKIPHVFGDLTGRNARKAIENIRSQNEQSGDKVYKSSAVNRERGKVTDKISASGNLMRGGSGSLTAGAMATAKIGTQQLPPQQDNVAPAGETSVLETDAGMPTGADTTVLDAVSAPADFQVEYDITFIHSDEVIV